MTRPYCFARPAVGLPVGNPVLAHRPLQRCAHRDAQERVTPVDAVHHAGPLIRCAL